MSTKRLIPYLDVYLQYLTDQPRIVPESFLGTDQKTVQPKMQRQRLTNFKNKNKNESYQSINHPRSSFVKLVLNGAYNSNFKI